MERTANILAAFEAGKLPSQQQFAAYINLINEKLIPNITPDENGGLSSNGVALAKSTRRLLNAYKQLGDHKNADNIVQKIIWHASKADLDATAADVTSFDTSGASKDADRVKHSFSTIFRIIWSSISSEGVPLFGDFSSFVRLALADAAEALEVQAGKAKEGLRTVDEQVQHGERDIVGRKKHEDDDIQAKFERGVDTFKEAGTTVIGASQTAVEKTSETYDDATSRLQEAYDNICDRALKDEEYHAAFNTLFSIAEKWLNRSLDALDTQEPSKLTLADFIDDPTPDQHASKALNLFSTLLERLSGGANLTPLLEAVRAAALDIRQDPDLKRWFDEFFEYSRRSLNERGYAGGEDAKKKKKALRQRWNALLNGESAGATKWRGDVEKVKKETRTVEEAIANDQDLQGLKQAHREFSVRAEGGGLSTGSMVEQATWFWTDLLKVYLPNVMDIAKNIPIPRTEYKDEEVEFVLENLDISTVDFLPSHTYIRNIADVDISSSRTHSTTNVGTLTHIRIQALKLALSDVSFWYRDKSSLDISGLLAFDVPEKGVDVDLQVRSISHQEERERAGHFHIIEKCEVRISEEATLTIRESNHGVLLTLFRPVFTTRVKEAVERVLAEQLRSLVLFLDGLAYDVGRRKEVFEDTGLSGGTSIAAAIWSELGHFRRSERGVSVTATGTGMIVESPGEGKTFAMGVEPQILSGEKHGPIGTASQPIAERLGGVVEGAQVSGEGVQKVKEGVKEGVNKVKSFKRSVEIRKEKEEKKPGWESDAFDL